MFSNFINRYDFIEAFRRGGKVLRGLAGRVKLKTGRARAAWSHTKNPPIYWNDIPAVKKRWNEMISGSPDVDYYQYISNTVLRDKTRLKGLSLGSGTGAKEMEWAETGHFDSITAFDLSESRVKFANERAAERGLDSLLHFRTADIYTIDFGEERYDVIFVDQSLHHFTPLAPLLEKVRKALTPDGVFLVNEFVGPTKFQWTEEQLEVINQALSALPESYRIRWRSSQIKKSEYRPSLLRMQLSDPSEAVQSADILPLLQKHFHLFERKGYGGNILHLLFKDIAHHFISDDEETKRLLQYCFDIEDNFLKREGVESDFTIALCRRKQSL